MGTLCQYCKVLEIDDASWGGFRDESIPGKNVAAFSGGTFHTLEDYDYLHGKYRSEYPNNHKPIKIQYFTCQYSRKDTFPELPDLKESAAGCGFCALLRDWIRWYAKSDSYRTFGDPERTIIIRSLSYTWYEAIGENDVPLRKFGGLNPKICWDDDSVWHFRGADIRIDAPKGPCATWLNIPEEPPKTPDLWEKISMIKSSLWKCSEECGHRKFSDSVPSRLIYVGEKTEFGFGDPRLVIMSDSERLRDGCAKDDVEYAVLSYCWGESASSSLKTTMENLATHLKKIPLAKMPATCRDAVLVTRALGLKWLWIDAFCIIQGNNEDWHNEAAEMAGVYGNAFVTIIPLRSLSSHDGFLDQMKKPAEVRVPFKSSIDPSVEGYYTIRASPEEWDVDLALRIERRSSKWQSRGWTYQEDFMSLRKLYFGDTDIYFRCSSQQTIICQSTATRPSELDGESWPLAERRGTTTIADGTKSGWYLGLNYFCTRDLTFKTDTFPAISAIAKMYCNGVQEDYQCGLWISDLHNGVLWRFDSGKLNREERMKTSISQNDYIAPSWSWASVSALGCTVMYPLHGYGSTYPLWRILETKSLLGGASNPFGRVRSGHILVQGRWYALSSLKLDYVKYGHTSEYDVWKGSDNLGACRFDWNVNDTNRSDMLSTTFTEDLVILLVAKDHLGHSGILLAPSARDETWYRVGLFQRGYFEQSDGIFQNWEERKFKIV